MKQSKRVKEINKELLILELRMLYESDVGKYEEFQKQHIQLTNKIRK